MTLKIRTPRRAIGWLTVALLVGAGSASAQQIVIHPGDEGFYLSEAARLEMAASLLDFTQSPLSGSIAGPGYLPFAETVPLEGRPLETVPAGGLGALSVVVRRLQPTTPMLVGDASVVEAELLSVHLASKAPLVFKPGPGAPPGSVDKQLDLRVRVSTAGPSPEGHAVITRTHAEGGSIQYAVTAHLALDILDGTTVVASLDPLGPFDFTTPATPWLYALGANYLASGMNLQSFVPPGVALDRNGDGIPDESTIGTTELITTAGQTSTGQPAVMSTHDWFSEFGSMLPGVKMILVTLHGDSDRDAVADSQDNCPLTYNPMQRDRDVDGIGDLCDPVNGARPKFNEVVLSSATHPDPPFVEIWGVAGVSTNGYAIAVIEGDGLGAGILDQVIDLGGSAFPSDNYFVIGKSGESYVDRAASGTWSFEAGTQTLLLLSGANLTLLNSKIGSQMDPDGDGITSIKSFCTAIEDCVAFWDGGRKDRAFDGATYCALGPANGLLPTSSPRTGTRPHGVYRGSALSGYVGGWKRTAHVRGSLFSFVDEAATPGAYNPL